MMIKSVTDWLLSGDPSICWQTRRDLLHEPEESARPDRERISTEGWGKSLLSAQGSSGLWSDSLYNGKWTSTTYTLLLLAELGILPGERTLRACAILFKSGIYNDEEIRFSRGQKIQDNGVTALVLRILCYFKYDDERINRIADYLVHAQNTDGSWHCNRKDGAAEYAFENTMLVLRGLEEYLKRYPQRRPDYNNAIIKGGEFLLKHNLYRQPDTGEPLKKSWLRLSFPNYWFYDIAAALDYFRETEVRDRRLDPAVDLLLKKKNQDGRWNLEHKYPGKTFFEMEKRGEPSKWITLRCLRNTEWRRSWNVS